jgi:peptidyl-prolyl cis-trans isomerase C
MTKKRVVILTALFAFVFSVQNIMCDNTKHEIKIETSEIEREFEKLPENVKAQYKEEELKEEIKMQLQEEKILRFEAEELGYNKREDYLRDVEDLKNNLLIASLIDEQVMKKVVLEEFEIEDFYNKNKEKFAEEESVEASHILIDTRGLNEEDKKTAKVKAEEILNLAIKGEEFSELAKKYSEGPTASRGGYLGWFTKGQMVEEFETASFECTKGDIYPELVESVYGYHIIYVQDKKEKTYIPYDEVKDNLKENLLNQKRYEAYVEYVEKLREKYGV